MRFDLYTRTVLTLIAIMLGVIALKPIFQPRTVAAQISNPGVLPYMWLSPQAGNTDQKEGKEFIDLRNGKIWNCNFKGCKLEGQYPLDQMR